MASDKQLLLASGSPRRKDLLASMGLSFEIRAMDIDESVHTEEAPLAYVQRMAKNKAQVAQQQVSDNTVVLAADTIVCQGEQIFGKPLNKNHAFKIWQQLSDDQHQVITAVALASGKQLQQANSITEVSFVAISESQMHQYWDSGEPQDKAGGYAIQGLASAWVSQLQGSYSNVVGLPLYEVNQLLNTVDLNWL